MEMLENQQVQNNKIFSLKKPDIFFNIFSLLNESSSHFILVIE
jgi:hypothetical protein